MTQGEPQISVPEAEIVAAMRRECSAGAVPVRRLRGETLTASIRPAHTALSRAANEDV